MFSLKLCIPILILSSVIGDALCAMQMMCYQCNSSLNVKCNDPFTSKELMIDCEEGSLCLKLIYTSGDDKITYRNCTNTDEKICEQYSGKSQHCSTCSVMHCNKAAKMELSLIFAIPIVLFIKSIIF